jgi:cytochrome c oxidase subunit II
MFSGSSSFVEGVDLAFFFIIGVSLLLLIGITIGMIYFSVKYNKKKHPKPKPTKQNNKLEVVWTVIPTLLVMAMFYFGWVGYRPMKQIPKDAISIKATGKMWSWTFEYENGKWDSLLYVPLNKPVKLDLYSPDVIHSLYIPAFRIKEDVVPGVGNQMWFKAEKLGEYTIMCAEYCGQRHSYMLSKVIVLPEEEYITWYNTKQEIKEGSLPGEMLIQKHGCIACHSIDGSKLVGPSFKGVFESMRKVDKDGELTEVKADTTYLINAILNPNDEIVEGYPKGIMTDYKDQISDEEVRLIVDYIKSLK